MRFLETKFALGVMTATLAASLACQRAPEQTAENNAPAAAAPAAPAPAATPVPAAAPAPAAAPKAPAPAAAKPAATKPVAANPVVSNPAPVAPKPIVLSAGTALSVRTTNTLSTKLQKTGDTFEVSLAEPLVVDGREVVPRNTMLMGRVVDSDPGGRVKGVASMSIELNQLHLDSGKMIEINTSLVSVEAASSAKKDAVKVGVATAVGTAIGAIAGGKKGAGIGAATGAGAGTAVVLGTRGDAAEVAGESLLDFTLSSPVTVPAN